MSIFKLLTNKLYIFYLIIVGCLIIILQLYLRLFRSRNSYSLDTIKNNIYPIDILISINFIFIQLVAILSILYYFYKLYYNIEKTSPLIRYASKIVDHLYWKPLEYIHDIIAPELPYSGIIFVYIADFVEKGNRNLRYKLYQSSYIIFDYLPQILVSSIFFVDIVILNQLYYFLYAVLLLIIPVLFCIYLKLAESFYIRNSHQFHESLNIIPLGKPDIHGLYLKWQYSLKSNYVYDAEIFTEFVKEYTLLKRIDLHIKYIRIYKKKYYPYIILFTSSLYLSAAVYRLIYILS